MNGSDVAEAEELPESVVFFTSVFIKKNVFIFFLYTFFNIAPSDLNYSSSTFKSRY